MAWILGDPKAAVYIALAVVLVAMILAVLLATWRDSLRALLEFFRVPRRSRPRFRLSTLLWFTAGCAIVLKLGGHFRWWPAWDWFGKIGVVALVLAFVLTAVALVRSYRSTYDRRPSAHLPTRVVLPGEAQTDAADAKKKRAGHVRPEVKHRQIGPFRR